MGTCISKCTPNHSILPQDKLVISQSPPPPTNSQPSSSSSSSSSSLSSSSSSSSSSSKTSTCSYSSSSTSKVIPYSNDFLLSCARENAHIIILDPHKRDAPKPKPSSFPVRALRSPIRPIARQPNQPVTKVNRTLPSKRERSSSPQPSIARQKSFRSEHSPASTSPNRTLGSPSPLRRPSGPSNYVIKDGHRLGGRNEKLQPLSPCNSLRRLNSGLEKGQNGRRREVLSKQSTRAPLIEEIDNPLITMECFIFL